MLRSVDRVLAVLAVSLLFAPLVLLRAAGPSNGPQPSSESEMAFGPLPPPGFYGMLPEPFAGPEAPEGVKRLVLLYNGCTVGEIEPCG